MIVGFTGTQQGLTLKQRQALRELLLSLPIDEFHHGDCIGADAAAHSMVRSHAAHIVAHPSDVKDKRAYCKGAVIGHPPKPPLERNEYIYQPADLLVACPKNDFEEVRSGTWATARHAHAAGKSITVVWPDGRVQPNWRPE